MSNVKSFSDKELLDRVESLPSFNGFPTGYWLIAVRSNEDSFNTFDDKFYLFKGEKFISVWDGTTNAGSDLLHPDNPRGEAVLKSNEIYYNAWERRLHRGKVLAYCQRLALPIFRDNDRDKLAEEIGTPKNEIVGINIHPSSYIKGSVQARKFIDGWSLGCLVYDTRSEFDNFMDLTKGQQTLTAVVLKEW